MNVRIIILPTQLLVFSFIYFWYYDYTVIINSSCIIQLLRTDSIIHSIGFIFRYFQIFNKNPFYKESIVYRYVYYFIVIFLIIFLLLTYYLYF